MSDKKKKKKAVDAAAPAATTAPAAEAGTSKKDAKVALETAKTSLKEFMAKHKLKEDSDPTDKAVKKEYAALRQAVKDAKATLKSAKGSKGGASGRNTTYDYPADMTDPKERKRFRAKQRAAANKPAGDAAPKKEKAAKAEAAPAAPAGEVKKKKKKKSSED